MMPDPLDFIAQFALLFAGYILLLSLLLYIRRKMVEEGKDWVGIQVILGIILIAVIIALFYFGFFLFYLSFFFVMPLFIGIPLLIAYRADSKRIRRKRIKYETTGTESDWRLIAGTLGPFLILIGAIILLIYSALSLILGGYDRGWTFSFLFTFLWGLIALIGVIFEVSGDKFGRFFCLIVGILAIAGQYIPIGRQQYDWNDYYTIYLSISFMQFEPFMILIGSLISFASKDEFFKYFKLKREFRKKYFDVSEQMNKVGDLEAFLKEKLSSDWEKIKASFEAYKLGELEKITFIDIALKNIGNKFIEIFREKKR